MRLSTLAQLLLLTSSTTVAWTTVPNNANTCRSLSQTTSLNASRGAKKWSRKKAWLEKRGFTEESEPLSATTSTNSSSETSSSSSSGLCTVVGGGRIGSLLSSKGETILLKRGDTIDPDGSGPILLATRNDALDSIVDNCPPNRRKDLVFLQNGYLDTFLESKGLLDNTQALLYLSVPALGVEAVDGITSVNPEGLTASTGEWAQALSDRLGSLDLKCNVVGMEEYRPAMFEKLIWISTYMLVGTAKSCTSVGQAGSDYTALVESVVTELVTAVSKKEGISFPEGTMARLAAYTDVVSDFPCGVKEFEWRNQYFYNLGDEECPIHNGLLRECAEGGKLGFELP
uniref:Opine dehydrogenase domain-containing protein n=1 Tax=Ditylum brightwellii TaxID=49249 RepID=A0A6V2DI38_9STRA|mmetsp:Transcript_21394/g.28478  ORF Transcript_21394/g.28478 Transcript_21394/m.28478 type:complete len:343 (+) Transcript_21394:101-1129(+)